MDNNLDISQTDSVVKSILTKFVNRAKMGKDKYGTDLDRTDLNELEWINHAQEELMDGILYLEKLKKIREYKNICDYMKDKL